jgi:hypothetical protein
VPGQRILVVEDEGIVALDIQSKLEGMGFDVPRVVSTAEEAVKAATQLTPNLVLMDIQLEGEMDGVDAAEEISNNLSIPVVYLTAYSDEHTLERAKAAHPFGYLLKPFEERELYATVEMAIYKHQADTERLRLEENLRQARKMEAIGQLTAGVAHHFNLMLQGIIGNLDLAAVEAADELRPFLDDAAFDADRAARLVRQLMLFYRQERIDHVAVDLTDLLDEVVNMCRGIFPRSIDIQHEVGAGLPAVLGNRTQLRQALANLCANARDAIALAGEGDHSIRLRAEATAPEAADAAAAGGSETVVRVDIADTGVGMDSATQERIFEPFYTTKEGGGPAGLGLAAAYGIIRDHGGWIGCESQPGVGTTMSIHLPTETTPSAVEVPRVSITEPTALPAAADLRPYRGDESVLVIADVDRFRKILDLMLERNG